ncbi:MAG TPA: YciI family protein [Fulvivirga sp.]|nr:YciI family protein [Fulvivirga sp.]
MKKLPIIFICLLPLVVNAQDGEATPPMEIVKYYFVELITNPDKPDIPKAEIDSIQAAHMANMGIMAKRGELMLAGPFEGGGGIFILNVKSMEEAKALTDKDPAISAGRLTAKIRPWYTAKGSFSIEKEDN